jgi:hypothetical protein
MYRYTQYRIKEFCLYSGALQGASTDPKKDGEIAFRAVLRIVRPTYPFQARSADSNLMMPARVVGWTHKQDEEYGLRTSMAQASKPCKHRLTENVNLPSPVCQ